MDTDSTSLAETSAVLVEKILSSVFPSIANFFDPLLTSDGQPYYRARYKNIIQEQVMLGYLTKGGVTYGDTENMTPHERKIALDTIKEVIENQSQAQQAAINQKNNTVKDPKSRMTS